jgi:hypothetical protein
MREYFSGTRSTSHPHPVVPAAHSPEVVIPVTSAVGIAIVAAIAVVAIGWRTLLTMLVVAGRLHDRRSGQRREHLLA